MTHIHDVHDKFVQFFIDNSLIQHVCSQTRMNNIHLVLCNDSHVVHDLCVTPPLANSDQASGSYDFLVSSASSANTDNISTSFQMYDYQNIDFEALTSISVRSIGMASGINI